MATAVFWAGRNRPTGSRTSKSAKPSWASASAGRGVRRTPVDAKAAAGVVADPEAQVLDRGQAVDEAEILVHEADAVLGRLLAVADRQRVAIDESRGAGIGLVIPGEDLDQRGFPRAVLADQRVHAAGVDDEIDAVKRDLTGKRLAQSADRQHGCHRGGRNGLQLIPHRN